MKHPFHTTVLTIELGVFAVPVTALFALSFSAAFFIFASPRMFVVALMIIALLLAILAFWSLVSVFWRKGVLELVEAPRRLWLLIAIGALYALLSGTPALFSFQENGSFVAFLFQVYWSGLPMLVPLSHLSALRFARGANKSMQPTCETHAADG